LHRRSYIGPPVENLTQRALGNKLPGKSQLKLGERADHTEEFMKIVESGIAVIINLFKVVDILFRGCFHCFPALFKPISALPDTPVQIEYPVYLGIAYSPTERLPVQRLLMAFPYLQACIDGPFGIALFSLGVYDIEKIVKRPSQIVEEGNR
jgi:hypothetical protein